MQNIREATARDWDTLWLIFSEIVSTGETYAYDINTTKKQAQNIWLEIPHKTYVFEEHGKILGTYYLKANQAGFGNHVCNCGYMVSSYVQGKGIATRMCEHSQQMAKNLGYKAMQFNFVLSSNTGAIYLWNKLGFETIGRLPQAYNHPKKGYIDALIMYKLL